MHAYVKLRRHHPYNAHPLGVGCQARLQTVLAGQALMPHSSWQLAPESRPVSTAPCTQQLMDRHYAGSQSLDLPVVLAHRALLSLKMC